MLKASTEKSPHFCKDSFVKTLTTHIGSHRNVVDYIIEIEK